MTRQPPPTRPAGAGVRPQRDLGEPSELDAEERRDVAHLLLELRTALDQLPSSVASERARELVGELLAREAEGPNGTGEGWRL